MNLTLKSFFESGPFSVANEKKKDVLWMFFFFHNLNSDEDVSKHQITTNSYDAKDGKLGRLQ
jgi:hypothetical protein